MNLKLCVLYFSMDSYISHFLKMESLFTSCYELSK